MATIISSSGTVRKTVAGGGLAGSVGIPIQTASPVGTLLPKPRHQFSLAFKLANPSALSISEQAEVVNAFGLLSSNVIRIELPAMLISHGSNPIFCDAVQPVAVIFTDDQKSKIIRALALINEVINHKSSVSMVVNWIDAQGAVIESASADVAMGGFSRSEMDYRPNTKTVYGSSYDAVHHQMSIFNNGAVSLGQRANERKLELELPGPQEFDHAVIVAAFELLSKIELTYP
jgi:hypothetical protein